MAEGMVELRSSHSFDETVAKIEAVLKAKGITVFAIVDHSGEAAKVGLTMPPTKLVIFGNPKAGTPVMVAAATAAIDLPLKLLVRQDAEGSVWVGYNTAEYLRERHGIPAELVGNLAGVEGLAKAVAE